MALEQIIASITSPFIKAFNNLAFTTSVALGCFALFTINYREIYKLPDISITCFVIVGILCASRSLVGLASWMWSAIRGIRSDIKKYFIIKREKDRISKMIPFLDQREICILSCLLAENMNMIEVRPDGEEAATLIARGFLVAPSRRPPAFHRDLQFVIPEYVWEVLNENSEMFEFKEEYEKLEVAPWRTPWMAR